MSSASETAVLSRYRDRHAFCLPRIGQAPAPELKLVVVIPVHDEPDIIPTLRSLYACHRPPCSTEIILVINSSSDAPSDVVRTNRESARTALHWTRTNAEENLRCHILEFPDLPPKHAGVGLARKIGMDEAAARLDRVGALSEGIIVCFDADCLCESNFLVQNFLHFEQHPDSAACSTYFEHPLAGPLPEQLYEAAAAYELHLRYYIESLRSIRFPYAHHTIGSSMSVRAIPYLQHGGMNRRKAGEDFYFLQKLMLNAAVTELTQTTVFPSVRKSHRVPFGTGKAIQNVLAGTPQSSYSFKAFQDLDELIKALDALASVPSHFMTQIYPQLPAPVRAYLLQSRIEVAAEEIAKNVSNVKQYKKRFWQWFNGFRCIKYLNWVSDTHYQRIKVEEAAREPSLLSRIGFGRHPNPETKTLLKHYRQYQKHPNPQKPLIPSHHPHPPKPKLGTGQ